jgi:hypothetical protein
MCVSTKVTESFSLWCKGFVSLWIRMLPVVLLGTLSSGSADIRRFANLDFGLLER